MEEYHKIDGPVLLRAAPGTGKTSTLGRRVRHLVKDRGAEPEAISVITFTVAAAASMKARISNPEDRELFLEPGSQPRMICTMHSLGHRIVCSVAKEVGLREPVSVVWSDVVRGVLAGDAAQLAGYKRSESAATVACRQFGDCRPTEAAKCSICDWYQRILRACNAIDHDDQILLACRLLTEHTGLLADYRSRCRHLLVDEYQDINAGQFRLIELLTEGQTNGLFAVGDDDQSIYSWRGGSPQFVRGFEGQFGSESRVEALPHCYRCPRNILEAASHVVREHDPDWKAKGELTYDRVEGPKVQVHSVPRAEREAQLVRRIAEEAWPAREVLVLVPDRGFVPLIAEQLGRARIRYVVPGGPGGTGLPLLERLGAWLTDENDSLALRECIEAMLSGTRLGVPSKRVRKPEKIEARESAFREVSAAWNDVVERHCSLWDSLRARRKEHRLVEQLAEDLERIREAGQRTPADFVATAVEKLEPWGKTQDVLREVDGWVNRATADAALAGPGMVRVMTFQGAKGLEADVVCVVGLEEGVHPRRGLGEPEVAEAARVMYVAMTRARYELHLFHARQRPASIAFQSAHTGDGAHTFKRSRFLDAIPGEFVEEIYHGTARR